jgi:peptidoglycan hydrolase-like protein with peptidoglycan-binding domain
MTFAGAALPLSREGLTVAAAQAGVDPAVLWSVVVVETSGCGFLPDRRPLILFERHIFSRKTGRRFDASNPGISGPPGGYGRAGTHQYNRLEEAIACDRRAALESASWGLGQVMGFNAALAGFRDAEDMVAQMLRGENEQILGMVSFMRARDLHEALQRRDWTEFARGYNGSDFAKNRYHEKLATAHTSLSRGGLPDFHARAVQLLLTYHGFNPGKIDGLVGEVTRAAITAFATKNGLPTTGDHKDLHAALLELLSPAADDQGVRSSSAPATPRAAPDLRVVQSLLEYLGWNPGPVDGKSGPRTRNAITGFQQSQSAAATGEGDAALLAALEAETRRRFPADIRLVQQLLAIRGFDTGGVDGLIGPRTRAAIAALTRTDHGSVPDAADARVLNALLARG